MTRWKKDAKEFEVSINQLKNRNAMNSYVCRIPIPIMEFLKNPDRLKFKIVGKKIEIQSVE